MNAARFTHNLRVKKHYGSETELRKYFPMNEHIFKLWIRKQWSSSLVIWSFAVYMALYCVSKNFTLFVFVLAHKTRYELAVYMCLFLISWAVFLPKIAESDEIWQRYHRNKKGGFFWDSVYWHSSKGSHFLAHPVTRLKQDNLGAASVTGIGLGLPRSHRCCLHNVSLCIVVFNVLQAFNVCNRYGVANAVFY